RAETLDSFRANVLALIKLLLLIAAAEIGMQAAPTPRAGIRRSTVPGVRIEDHHTTRRRNQFGLVPLRRGGIQQNFLRRLAAQVRTRYTAGCAVALVVIVQQPDRVADIEIARLDRTGPIDVERLVALAGQRIAEVQRRQLEFLSEHVGDPRQDARIGKAD